MDQISRRQALTVTAAGAALAGLGNTALSDEKEAVQSSGAVTSAERVTELSMDVSGLTPRAVAAGLQTLFGRITPDASPGRNSLTISGLPQGTRAISVWVTEWASGNKPHAGGAFYYTTSVQLYDEGRKCRVIFNLDWGTHLATAAQVIYGPA